MSTTQPTKITSYVFTKRMSDALLKECQKAESQKKTEQKILYLLKFVDKKKVKNFKKFYINFIIRYEPKTKHEDILKMACQVKKNFRDLERILIRLTHISIPKKGQNDMDINIKNEINKDIHLAINTHQHTFNIMRDYIGRYKCVNRGKWSNNEEHGKEIKYLTNLIKMEECFNLGKYQGIISAANKCLNTWVDKCRLYVGLLDYYEEKRKERYYDRLRNKAKIRANRFEKLILKGLFTSLAAPITDNNGEGEIGKETLNYMWEHTREIYEEKYKDIKEIVHTLTSPLSSSTDYEIIYSAYLKHI